jgi:hypothetical protein
MSEKTEIERKAEEGRTNAAETANVRAGGLRLRGRKCPACKSERVRRSQMRGLFERSLLKALGVKAYRCEKCDARFYRFGSRSHEKAQPAAGANGGQANLK